MRLSHQLSIQHRFSKINFLGNSFFGSLISDSFRTKHKLMLNIFFSSDVNECNSNPCQHVCHNTYGSFTCQCHPCYTKLGRQCELRQCQINGHQCFPYGTINPSNSCQVMIFQSLSILTYKVICNLRIDTMPFR